MYLGGRDRLRPPFFLALRSELGLCLMATNGHYAEGSKLETEQPVISGSFSCWPFAFLFGRPRKNQKSNTRPHTRHPPWNRGKHTSSRLRGAASLLNLKEYMFQLQKKEITSAPPCRFASSARCLVKCPATKKVSCGPCGSRGPGKNFSFSAHFVSEMYLTIKGKCGPNGRKIRSVLTCHN